MVESGRFLTCVAAVVVVAALFARVAAQDAVQRPLVVPLAGEGFKGTLVAVDGEWNLTFATDSEKKTLPAADLLRWGRCAELRRSPVVVLADGGMLRADSVNYDGRRLKIESPLFDNVSLSPESVAGVVFELPVDRHEAELLLDWAGNRAGDGKNADGEKDATTTAAAGGETVDRIRFLNGDELTGRIVAVDDREIHIEPDLAAPAGAAAIDVDPARVAALRFADCAKRGHSPLLDRNKKPTFYVWAGLADGSLLAVDSMRLEEGKLSLRLLGGTPDPAGYWLAAGEDLVFLQSIGPGAIYLSDLPAAEYRHVPYLELPWPYRIDRNVTGGRLRCGGRLFVKGLGVHSSARLTYMLDGVSRWDKSHPTKFERFEAAAGIDDSTGGMGSVRFRVYVDAKKKYAGPIVRGGDRPTPISVDVRGARRLDLIVDFGDRADQQDHADWLDARLIQAKP